MRRSLPPREWADNNDDKLTYEQLLDAGRNGTPVSRKDAIAAIEAEGYKKKATGLWIKDGKTFYRLWSLIEEPVSKANYYPSPLSGCDLTITLTD